MDAVSWAAQTTTALAPYGAIPILHDPGAWRAWASVVVNLPALAALNAPRPEGFETWQDWGRAFNVAVRLLLN